MIKQLHVSSFQKFVLNYYSQYGRHQLPWRQTHDPYHIMVSEIMLQQTQVDRVIPKYLNFIEQFPTIPALAKSSFPQVLTHWMGLGYNRRAKYLHQCAQVLTQVGESLPNDQTKLLKLPGIGSYTAAAIQAFAFNQPVPIIETNIRTVYFYHFFDQSTLITDRQLQPLITQTIHLPNPRMWYWALMDYGSYLKKQHGNLNRQSTHYSKQSKFIGSRRQLRAHVLRLLLAQPLKLNQLSQHTNQPPDVINDIVHQLLSEQLIQKQAHKYQIISQTSDILSP